MHTWRCGSESITRCLGVAWRNKRYPPVGFYESRRKTKMSLKWPARHRNVCMPCPHTKDRSKTFPCLPLLCHPFYTCCLNCQNTPLSSPLGLKNISSVKITHFKWYLFRLTIQVVSTGENIGSFSNEQQCHMGGTSEHQRSSDINVMSKKVGSRQLKIVHNTLNPNESPTH